MFKRKTIGSRGAIGAAVALSALLVGGAVSAKDLTMGTTSPTSSHFTISVAMSKAIETGMEDTTVNVIETGASVDNVLRLARDEIDLGLATTDILIAARNGTGKFDGNAIADTVALYPYSASVLLIAATEASGVTTLGDLDGKKFNPGIRGSAAENLTTTVLSMFDINADLVHGAVGDAVEGIKNRQIIGYSKYGAANSVDATLQELMTSTEMRLIGFSEEQEKAATQAMEGVGFTTLPAGLIAGSEEMRVPKLNVFFLTRTGVMDDDTAYDISRSIHQNMDLLVEAWPQLAEYDTAADAVATMEAGIVYHPGAARYWKEAVGN
ncbi:TAXI family TRAP transporter solute-binding subunit [uncultured Sulfitobacter sp.]|uniref:TAXI family TRAP transporter solute-binding subunit n=1 Tax=uncultured Sulfitobacter sp. TaxID=191468 RepID=UPI00262771F9|nr:TAXI family TRAP transporter solute-binding subunit [uncultured Sulfitobacter sp.]